MKRTIDDAEVFANGFCDVEPWTDQPAYEVTAVYIDPWEDTLYIVDDNGNAYRAEHRDDLMFYTSDLEKVDDGASVPAAVADIVDAVMHGPVNAMYCAPADRVYFGLFAEGDPEGTQPSATFWLRADEVDGDLESDFVHDRAELAMLEAGLDTSFVWHFRPLKK